MIARELLQHGSTRSRSETELGTELGTEIKTELGTEIKTELIGGYPMNKKTETEIGTEIGTEVGTENRNGKVVKKHGGNYGTAKDKRGGKLWRREDNIPHCTAEENAKYIHNSIRLAMLPECDRHDAEEVRQRIVQYFEICAEDDIKPSVVGLALAFGMHRTMVLRIANGMDGTDRTYSAEVRDLFARAYTMINLQLENYMIDNRVNTVAGIFALKNHFGYADRTELLVAPAQTATDYSAADIRDRYITTGSETAVTENTDG